MPRHKLSDWELLAIDRALALLAESGKAEVISLDQLRAKIGNAARVTVTPRAATIHKGPDPDGRDFDNLGESPDY